MAKNYPGSNEDDLKSLAQMASQGESFEEAMDGWDGRMTPEECRKPYEDFLAWNKPPGGAAPVSAEPAEA